MRRLAAPAQRRGAADLDASRRRSTGQPGEIYGVADHATYRDNWPMLEAAPDVWDAVAAGEGVLVNEQLCAARGAGAGRPDGAAGRRARCRVVGVYSDYGNPEGAGADRRSTRW